MGTSKDYTTPPAWRNTKALVTRRGGQPVTPSQCEEVVREFINNAGGAEGFAAGSGGANDGRTAQQAGQRLAAVVGALSGGAGAAAGLGNIGLGHLAGVPARDLLNGILDHCTSGESIIDAVDVRAAMSSMLDEMLEEHPDDVDEVLSGQIEGWSLLEMLIRYFGWVIYHIFCRSFYAHLVKRHGSEQAASFLEQVRDFIFAALRDATFDINVGQVNWAGAQGRAMMDDIMRRTLRVFTEPGDE